MAIRTAVIGLGIMGRRMVEYMDMHAQFDLVSMWDPDAAACDLSTRFAPHVTVADNARAAVDAADLVYLACPPKPRKDFALMAALAGKAVFMEKPLGVDVGESRDLVERLAHSDVPSAVNFTQAAGKALTDVSRDATVGALGDLQGADIVVTYATWPRQWQVGADWLRFRAEGGMTREVISHFLFFSERILGPLNIVWSRADYPDNQTLCETHVAARLETETGLPVTIMGSIGGAQPDRQELTIKGTSQSRRISEFFCDAVSDGGPFVPVGPDPENPRATSLNAQLDDLVLLCEGKPNRLATLEEALRVQLLVEGILTRRH